MSNDITWLRAQLNEYNPDVPRCYKSISVIRDEGIHYVPCCRSKGHEGDCGNSRRVLGWPGYTVLSSLLDELEQLRKEK